MTKTQATYHKCRMLAGIPQDVSRGPACQTLELARLAHIEGDETAIVRVDWRLGGDGLWHETSQVIVEWHQGTGEVR